MGAVLIDASGEFIAAGHNHPISAQDPTAHAEIVVLRAAARHLQNYRLPGTTLYVTLEPCAMCAGAILLARIPRLYYGAADPRAGAHRSVFRIFDEPRLNHRVEVIPGVGEPECRALLMTFFTQLREKPSSENG